MAATRVGRRSAQLPCTRFYLARGSGGRLRPVCRQGMAGGRCGPAAGRHCRPRKARSDGAHSRRRHPRTDLQRLLHERVLDQLPTAGANLPGVGSGSGERGAEVARALLRPGPSYAWGPARRRTRGGVSVVAAGGSGWRRVGPAGNGRGTGGGWPGAGREAVGPAEGRWRAGGSWSGCPAAPGVRRCCGGCCCGGWRCGGRCCGDVAVVGAVAGVVLPLGGCWAEVAGAGRAVAMAGRGTGSCGAGEARAGRERVAAGRGRVGAGRAGERPAGPRSDGAGLRGSVGFDGRGPASVRCLAGHRGGGAGGRVAGGLGAGRCDSLRHHRSDHCRPPVSSCL